MNNTLKREQLLKQAISGELLFLRLLEPNDFEALHSAASNPKIWEQHPQKDRYKREIFQKFFDSALESVAAYAIIDNATEKVIGSTRYYSLTQHEQEAYAPYVPRIEDSICIGYTFLQTEYWGGKYNKELKEIMIRHACSLYSSIIFQVGVDNKRSRIAVERLGATLLPYKDELANEDNSRTEHVIYRLDCH